METRAARKPRAPPYSTIATIGCDVSSRYSSSSCSREVALIVAVTDS